MRARIAARWAARLGYKNIWVMPWGWTGWQKYTRSSDYQVNPFGLDTGDIFPQCRLSLMPKQEDRLYLGLSKNIKSFHLNDIKSQYLFILAYDDQGSYRLERQAVYKEMFQAIQEDRELAGQLKMIGLALGGLKRIVHRYARVNRIPFPLFSDPEREVFHCLGDPKLPLNYLLVKEEDGYRILCLNPGPLTSSKEALKKITATIGYH